MKNWSIILLTNILILLFMIVSLNIFIKRNINNENFEHELGKILPRHNLKFEFSTNIQNYKYEKNMVKLEEITEENDNKYCGERRFEYNQNNNGNSIIVLGCSYAYGHGLKKEETFPSILSNITQSSIYNFSKCGSQLGENISDMKKETKNINQDIKYIVYLYMQDHINRMLLTSSMYKYYELYLGLGQNKVHNYLIKKIPLYKLICVILNKYKIQSNFKNIEKFLKNSILLSYKELSTLYPNSKFIIILYEEKLPDSYSHFEIAYLSNIMNSKIWTEIEKETNIQIVRTSHITGFYFDKEYKLKEDISNWHPNAKAWEKFTPLFAEKYIK